MKEPWGDDSESGGGTSSGFFRIGDMQVCWGLTTLVGQAATDTSFIITVPLPRPFLSGDYAVSFAFRHNGGGAHLYNVAPEINSSLGSGSFDVLYTMHNGNAVTTFGYTAAAGHIYWTAVGRWR